MALFDWLRNLFRPRPVPPSPPPGPFLDLLGAVNAERIKHGLPVFRADAALIQGASNHAAQMALTRRLSHDGFTARLAAAIMHSGSENVAEGQRTPAECVASWMASDGHRTNLLGHWQYAGAGNVGVWWCLTMGDR